MTWLTHQGRGFFGFDLDGNPRWSRERKDEAPRWEGELSITEAFRETGDLVSLFFRWLEFDAPPFSGGFMEWPQRVADGLIFCKREWACVQTHAKREAQRG